MTKSPPGVIATEGLGLAADVARRDGELVALRLAHGVEPPREHVELQLGVPHDDEVAAGVGRDRRALLAAGGRLVDGK
jgi:hypothetical protein